MPRLFKLCVPAAFVLAGCMEPDVGIFHSVPLWMEWPAEAQTGMPFGMRLVGHTATCVTHQELRVDVERFAEGVAFRSLLVVDRPDARRNEPAIPDSLCGDAGFYDTTVTVAGLAATAERSYWIWRVDPTAPQLTAVGTIVVRATAPETDRANASGYVLRGSTDTEGCAAMQRHFPAAPIAVENPPAATWQGFAFGYFFTPAAPLCGQTRAFHIDSLI